MREKLQQLGVDVDALLDGIGAGAEEDEEELT